VLNFVSAFPGQAQDAQKRMGVISGSTAQQAIYIRDIRSFAIQFPPFEEQIRIINEVERIFSVVMELERIAVINLKRSGRLRRAVLQRAFNGKMLNDNR